MPVETAVKEKTELTVCSKCQAVGVCVHWFYTTVLDPKTGKSSIESVKLCHPCGNAIDSRIKKTIIQIQPKALRQHILAMLKSN